ncbi:MAG: tRNA uridine-5-carboxymethylaminomethyl(34) synthesis GTPase MnmE, partial [Humidesulfovibrio sp.]|nr:tRNA uridine-5-carboxymethylaminomethyl(34) synthesis GTPase MnmE [Humidesulfovibrio sp.]
MAPGTTPDTAPGTVFGTIVAIATAAGPGAVGIVRLSGPEAPALAQALFRSPHPGFTGLKPRRLHHGSLVDATGRVLDEVLVAFMPGPGSFTGEDVVELFCHGGPAVLRAVLEELLTRGARLATPGEFTLCAFLNGRLDLTQAEAVAEMIAAPTRAALHLAQMKLSGALSQRIAALREALESLRARLCLAVDFPDEDVECLPLP